MHDQDHPRLNKTLAGAGLCSRRDADKFIRDGRVRINGQVVTDMGRRVLPSDHVEVDGSPLPKPQDARLWRYHKPNGLVTSHKDEKGRKTVFQALPEKLPRVISVGRLDLNSEGLLLLTTSGPLARVLEHPKTALARSYRCRVYGDIDRTALSNLKTGITLEGIRYGPVLISNIQHARTGRNHWLEVTIHEGKNREVRKVLAACGLEVNRLIRLAYGPFSLGNLARGAVQEVPLQQFQKFLEAKI